jgi:hypothetical protein
MESMKGKLAEWRVEIKSDDSFRAFYYFVFDYLREANKVILRTHSTSHDLSSPVYLGRLPFDPLLISLSLSLSQ